MKLLEITPRQRTRLYAALVKKEADIRGKGRGTFFRVGRKAQAKAEWKHKKFQGSIRLERGDYVKRVSHPSDRRFNQIVLTPKGQKLEAHVEKSYFKEVDKMMNVLSPSEKRGVVKAMESIRQYIIDNGA